MRSKGGGFTDEQKARLRELARQWLADGQGRTQVQLAKLLDFDKGRISRFLRENSAEGISPAAAVRLAELTGHDLTALMGGEVVRVATEDDDLPGLEEQIARAHEHGVSKVACNGAARMARALGPPVVTSALFDRLVDIADRFGASDSVEAEIASAATVTSAARPAKRRAQ